jgi:hypothetical protein
MKTRLSITTAMILVFLAALSAKATAQPAQPVQFAKPEPRKISGIYPDLTVYGIYSENGAHTKPGHEECGIGAIVPWGGKLWMVNYAPHKPRGSEHKLFSVDADLKLVVHPESVGGTPAGRMIHEESQQLFIAHYAISADGTVRAIPIDKMPIRVTAITRHLSDPANKVYYVDMEGSIWEADVHTLAVTQLFKKPVPGWHAKGGYVSQGRLVISNNGELSAGSYKDLLVGGKAETEEDRGVLAQYDGKNWSIIERRQYTDVTGPPGIKGGSDSDAPIWAIGWDRRSLRLKLLDQGKWSTFLLPKAAFCNDAYHGWYTEWPRIREITDGRWMMDMHGMFFDFPPTFSRANTSGIRPIGSHLRYIPDFCHWNGQLVLASDETSIQGNPLAGQPQSNLWFGNYEDLKSWGPASGYGGPWVNDTITANQPSDPFLVAGFDRRVIHLATTRQKVLPAETINRAADQQAITSIPKSLVSLPRIALPRGDWKKPTPGFQFTIDQPATVFLAVDKRGEPKLSDEWILTDMSITWGNANYTDAVYQRSFAAGTVEIPRNVTEHIPGSFGMPHLAFIQSGASSIKIAAPTATVVHPKPVVAKSVESELPIRFKVEIDKLGNGNWEEYSTLELPAEGYSHHVLPDDFAATWLRFSTDRDCVATAVLHQTTKRFNDARQHQSLFAGLADVDATSTDESLLYPAKRNRNLIVIDKDGDHYEFTKDGFDFQVVKPDPELATRLRVEPEFTVDEASVILKHRGKRLRLPKGDAMFDRPMEGCWPRGSREVQSERHLANIHGTFYEVPLLLNGQPPAFELMRPVASHRKRISDFCSWNGLLVLAGVNPIASPDGHVYKDTANQLGLWFGGIDDLWKLGKPVGKGGPWKLSSVMAGIPSDAYLMTGYDKKSLAIEADVDTQIVIEVDVDHQSGWHRYQTLDVKAGEPRLHEFPDAFSAHWVRLTSSANAVITAEFTYQ